MASEVEICNLALSHVGADSIQSLDDKTKEANKCKLHYGPDRDAVLGKHRWSFATKRVILALLSETVTGWEFAYQYPSDCLKAREIYNDLNNVTGLAQHHHCHDHIHTPIDRIPFEVMLKEDGSSKMVVTDKEDAELVYTAKVTDPNIFDTQFIDALSWKLASNLARPLRANERMETSLFNKYLFIVGAAEAASANEQEARPDETNVFIKARR